MVKQIQSYSEDCWLKNELLLLRLSREYVICDSEYPYDLWKEEVLTEQFCQYLHMSSLKSAKNTYFYNRDWERCWQLHHKGMLYTIPKVEKKIIVKLEMALIILSSTPKVPIVWF